MFDPVAPAGDPVDIVGLVFDGSDNEASPGLLFEPASANNDHFGELSPSYFYLVAPAAPEAVFG